jgi:hypothetical protein
MWDLSLSCDSSTDDQALNGCACTFAEELRNFGLLSCGDMSRCPSECPICYNCLTLLGCDDSTNSNETEVWASTSDRMFIIGAVVGSFVVTLAASYYVRKRIDASSRGEFLIDDDAGRTVIHEGFYGARRSSSKQVALAGSRYCPWDHLDDNESVSEGTRSEVGNYCNFSPPGKLFTSGFAQLAFDNDTLQVVDAIASLEKGRVSPKTTIFC